MINVFQKLEISLIVEKKKRKKNAFTYLDIFDARSQNSVQEIAKKKFNLLSI